MSNKYITRDKLADILEKMWSAGIRVDFEPQRKQITIHKPDGNYEWIPVYDKTSYDELIASLLPSDNVDEQ